MSSQPPQTYTRVALAIVIAAVVISATILASSAIHSAKTVSKTTTVTDTFAQTVIVSASSSSASCDGAYPVCPESGQTFTLSVNYTGAWRVSYQGYDTAGCSNCYNNSALALRGSYDGSGPNTRSITLNAEGMGWTLCAQAQKSDASSSALILYVLGARNETSLPFGTASACSEVEVV